MVGIREKSELDNQINTLKLELENSTALYERYRERARQSLSKSSSELEETQNKLSDLQIQLTQAQSDLRVLQIILKIGITATNYHYS